MDTAVDLFWLPLGAGGHSVKHNGRAFEALVAWREHRARSALYHSALELREAGERFVVEMTPVRRNASVGRAVAAVGDVGMRGAGRLRLFRYEVCLWRNGTIPDVAEAVESPRHLSGDAAVVRRIREALPQLPTPVWGRDELRTGEMWNSNSVTSWLLATAGLTPETIPLPEGGRAPGWSAGCVVARRR